MSSIGLSGMSGISESTLQTRYEKALKQINKLIEMNRQLKEAVTQYETQGQEVQAQLEEAQRAGREFDEENNILESKYMELDQHYRQLQEYCTELQSKYEEQQLNADHYQQQIHQMEQKYHEELENEIMKNTDLTRQADMINQMYQESFASLEQQSEKIAHFEEEHCELLNKTSQLEDERDHLAGIVKDKNVDLWEGKVQQANTIIEKLVKECSELKSRQIDRQVQDEKKQVERMIGYNTIIDPRQSESIKMLVNDYKNKFKAVEQQKKQLERKYKHLKSQSTRFVPQETYILKIDSLQKLTEKQQYEMSRLIETYDTELNFIAVQNHKLKESFASLSEELSQTVSSLTKKEQETTQLRLTSDKINFENQSLKRVNDTLVQTNVIKLKELQPEMPQTESYTYIEKKTSVDYQLKEEHLRKLEKEEQAKAEATPLFRTKDIQFSSTHAVPQHRHAPITVTYPQQSHSQPQADPNFKFIQSVNIINGYNVSLGETSSQPLRK